MASFSGKISLSDSNTYYRPNPLFYGVGEDFYSTFKLAVTMNSPVEHRTLSFAVQKAAKRYPYFCVRPVLDKNRLVLQSNPLPIPVFPDDRTPVLGTGESGGHLVSFGCEKNMIFLNASHFIADGMGILPFLKTVLCLYVSAVSGREISDSKNIRLPEDPVPEEEFAWPFPELPIEYEKFCLPKKSPEKAYPLDPRAFGPGGLYAYHLHIPQKTMMAKANPSDGSPVSFLSVMLYRAICRLDPGFELPVVAHIQHQYRFALGTPLCHQSLVNYIPAVLPSRLKNRSIEQQNTAIRGQVILGSEKNSDLAAVERFMKAWPDEEAGLSEKRAAMAEYAGKSILGKTFGISYVGKISWDGLDRYITDLHAYIGEKNTENMLLIEVMTVGEDFSLTFMQSGPGRRYLDAFVEELQSCGIPASIAGERAYSLCKTRFPE